jgi:hypothetical protein
MAASAPVKHAVSPDHIARYEKKIQDVRAAVSQLPGEGYYTNLLGIIHRPGWTSIAEGLYFEALVDTIHVHAQQLSELHKRLAAAADAV